MKLLEDSIMLGKQSDMQILIPGSSPTQRVITATASCDPALQVCNATCSEIESRELHRGGGGVHLISSAIDANLSSSSVNATCLFVVDERHALRGESFERKGSFLLVGQIGSWAPLLGRTGRSLCVALFIEEHDCRADHNCHRVRMTIGLALTKPTLPPRPIAIAFGAVTTAVGRVPRVGGSSVEYNARARPPAALLGGAEQINKRRRRR